MSNTWTILGPAAFVLFLIVAVHYANVWLTRPPNDLDRRLAALDRAIDEDHMPHRVYRSPAGWRHGLDVPYARENAGWRNRSEDER